MVVANKMDDRGWEGNILANLGITERQMECYEEALTDFDRAIER